MKYVLGLKCIECGREQPALPDSYVCAACGGNQDVVFDYARIAKDWSKEILDWNTNRSIWRYFPLLPIEPETSLPRLQIGWTPVYEYRDWAEELGIGNLWLKDDGRNPSASFKDRASAVVIAKALEARA